MVAPVKAGDIQPEKVEWLWRERVPRGMMTDVGGRPENGKGLLVAHIAAEVSRTRYTDPDGTRRWGRVLYSAAEDSHSLMTVPRLLAAGANMDNVLVWRFRLPADRDQLEAQLRRERYDLLVMDPIAAHLSHGVNRHTDRIRMVLNPLSELLEETRCACVFVDHVVKHIPKNGTMLNAFGGSGSGLVAACRMAFVFGKDPADEDTRMLCYAKSNLRPKPLSLRFELDTAPVTVRDPLTGDTEDMDVAFLVAREEMQFDGMRLFDAAGKDGAPARGDKRAEASDWLASYLFNAGEPVKAGTVVEDAKQVGLTAKTLRRAADDMGILRNPPGGGRNCTWELPDDRRAEMRASAGQSAQKPAQGLKGVDDLLDSILGKDDEGDQPESA